MKHNVSSSFGIGLKQLNVAYNHSAGNSKTDKYEKETLVKMCQERPFCIDCNLDHCKVGYNWYEKILRGEPLSSQEKNLSVYCTHLHQGASDTTQKDTMTYSASRSPSLTIFVRGAPEGDDAV